LSVFAKIAKLLIARQRFQQLSTVMEFSSIAKLHHAVSHFNWKATRELSIASLTSAAAALPEVACQSLLSRIVKQCNVKWEYLSAGICQSIFAQFNLAKKA
jgi:hypothetical protein